MALNHNNYKVTHPYTVRARVGTDRNEVASEVWYSVQSCYSYPRCTEYISGVRCRVYRFTPDQYQRFSHAMDALPCACDASEALNICTCEECGVVMSHTEINAVDGICRYCFTENNEDISECEECGGDGEYFAGYRGISWNGTPLEYYTPCHACEGSGWSGESIEDAWVATLEF